MIRLDHYLCHESMLTRKQAKTAIRCGRVQVGDRIEKNADCKVDEIFDTIFLDGKQLAYQKYRYYYLDKPLGYVTATEDRAEKTVLDLFPEEIRKQGIFPVGRLDKDTTGLLLLTNDGEFAHRIISPNSMIPKRYIAEVSGKLCREDIDAFAEGILLADGTHCLPASMKILGENTAEVTLFEGKYHQVRRMFASLGKPVSTLCRISIGNLALPDKHGTGIYHEILTDDLCTRFNSFSLEK